MLMVKSLGMILKNIYSALEIKICNIKGFSFILDTNDEYDVKNLFQRKSPRLENNLGFNSFKETEDDHKFAVMLKTISEI